ncbi:MAG: HAD family hydrolase [Rikenellaceae bacterium]
MKQLIIFDLDGTLLNTIGDLAACCNQTLEKHQLPTHSDEEYASFVGNGIMRLVERTIPEPLRTVERVAEIRKDFVALYTENIAIHSTPYAGIVELLRTLSEQGVAVAIASNKFQAGCEKLAKHYFPNIRFATVLGQRPNIALKPDPYIIREIIQRTSYTPDKILFVGDSGVDMQTASAAGVDSVGVTWGFRSREELEKAGAKHIIDTANQLLEIIHNS